MKLWIRMDAVEATELLVACGNRKTELQREMEGGSPKLVETCTKLMEMVDALQLRIATSLKAFDTSDDSAWAAMLLGMAEDCAEATKTAAGENPLFSDVRDLVAQELMDEPERVV